MCMKTLEKENLDKVFRAYDVRGIVNDEIDEALCFAIGYALGKLFEKICVGHDHRPNSEKFAKAIIRGLNTSGKTAVFLGLCPTPLVQFGAMQLGCDAGVMITASHNPKEYNGVKVFRRDCKRIEWEKIKEIILKEKNEIASRFEESGEPEYEEVEIREAYKKFLKTNFSFTKRFKVVIDGSNGPMGELAREVLSDFGFEVSCIACKVDASFPAHEPDPSKERNTELCKENVLKHKADFGLCFDGDGDRIIFIDEKARFIPGDYTLAIISLLYEKPKVVTEVKVSKAVVEFIERKGGSVVLERVGNVFVRKTLVEKNCDFAGEYSGHYFFREYPVDDGLYSALKVISVIEKLGKNLSEIFDDIPKYYSSPELRIRVGEDMKWKIVEDAKRYFAKSGKVIDIDGVRVESDDSWGLLRASNTEPKISLRVEGKTKESYESMFKKFVEFLKKYGVEVR